MAGHTFLDDLHCLDINTMVWSVPSVSGTCPPALAAHGSAVIGTSVYMFGGWSPSETGPVAQDTLYCLHTDKDKLHWDIVAFTGPPPPARFDFAMCAIEIPTCPVTSGNRENIVHEISEPVKDDEDTSVKETSSEAKYSSEACGDSESASSIRQTSFNAVTVINPSGRDFKGVPDNSLQKVRGDEDCIEKLEVSSGDICWTDALYIFGGLDSAGEVYNDSFILVP